MQDLQAQTSNADLTTKVPYYTHFQTRQLQFPDLSVIALTFYKVEQTGWTSLIPEKSIDRLESHIVTKT